MSCCFITIKQTESFSSTKTTFGKANEESELLQGTIQTAQFGWTSNAALLIRFNP